jgi:hypothetical protein
LPLAPGPEIGEALSGSTASDLVARATALLAQEAARLPVTPSALLDSAGGVTSPSSGQTLPPIASRALTSAPLASPGSAGEADRLRRAAQEWIESVLKLLLPTGNATGDRVPLIECAAAVAPGEEGRAILRVMNDEDMPSEVTLYCTNFVADSGCEIPALRVTILPRCTTIPPKGQAAFELKIAVPQQTRAGWYSGLVQARGAKYVKAVLSLQVQ